MDSPYAPYRQGRGYQLDAYIVHWNTKRRQEKLEGHTPGGVPEHVPRSLEALS